jgi:peptidoglycan/LPS O-acetylase OafA/YrhL
MTTVCWTQEQREVTKRISAAAILAVIALAFRLVFAAVPFVTSPQALAFPFPPIVPLFAPSLAAVAPSIRRRDCRRRRQGQKNSAEKQNSKSYSHENF